MIALDALGGDFGPKPVVQGAYEAARRGVPVMLCGPQELLSSLLHNVDPAWQTYPITIRHAPDAVAMDEEPVYAVRKKQTSSLVVAVQAVAAGDADAVISAGNSGALMAGAALFIGRQPNVERPAIAAYLPSAGGDVLVLDVGANTECRATHLVQFAHLATEFLRTRGLQTPRVALLSNGHEEGKGSALVKETHELLRQDAAIHFVGNVEPYDLFAHKADIIVCDGFAGNVLLKTIETMSQLFAHWGKSFISQHPEHTASLQQFQHFCAQKMTLQHHGGALLLGVQKPVIVCHGAAHQDDITNALLFAYHYVTDCRVAAPGYRVSSTQSSH